MEHDMNIILGKPAADIARERYVVLELDHFRVQGHPDTVPAYCVIEHIGLDELGVSPALQDLHANLIQAYRRGQWSYCLQALDNLQGHWRGHLDSFYNDLRQRIVDLQDQPLDQQWDGSILRESTALEQ